MYNKFLTTKTGIHTHQQHHIHVTDNIDQHSHRSRRIQCDSRFHSGILYLLHHSMQVYTGFIMHIHHHCSQIFHFFNEFLGINNHQMYIQRFFRQLGYIFQYRKTKRNIRYKHTIHYINMQPVGITTIYLFYVCL